MEYISTRGHSKAANFTEILMAGLAPDGGLYMPTSYPKYSFEQLRQLQAKNYIQLTEILLWPFIENSDINKAEFSEIVKQSYKNFSHPAICPLIQTASKEFIAELFHGPSLAFKDIAMQFLANLIEKILAKTDKKINVIAATSGDTGSAAIEAFAKKNNAKIFILFPKGRVSEIQQKQMTTTGANNIYAIAIDGCFDDCQAIVKTLFNDQDFVAKVAPTAVNSINWARILAQSVYYFYTALALGAPDKKVSFSVPTGNFGNIFAGYLAKKMGLPIEKIIIATNENDILTRLVHTGIYQPKTIHTTTSPSMDIQISSNFERLLFDISGGDSNYTNLKMQELNQNGYFALSDDCRNKINEYFMAGTATIEDVNDTIKNLYQANNYLCDPHTAVGIHVARHQQQTSATPIIALATASAAKFPETVKKACGIWPDLPEHARSILTKDEVFYSLDSDAMAVKELIYKQI